MTQNIFNLITSLTIRKADIRIVLGKTPDDCSADASAIASHESNFSSEIAPLCSFWVRGHS
jgi:hypothetical protein